MRIAVTGSRKAWPWEAARLALSKYPGHHELLHGNAQGVDRVCAVIAASDLKWKVTPFHADWPNCTPICPDDGGRHRKKRGRGAIDESADGKNESYCPIAGHWRNQRMIDAKPDILIAFAGGTGTADCRKRAVAAGIPIVEGE